MGTSNLQAQILKMVERYQKNVDIRMEIKPPLTISGIPEGTKSLALIMDDPDAMGAVGKVWVHWVAWNIDPTKTLIHDWIQKSTVEE